MKTVLNVSVIYAGKTFIAFAGGKRWVPMQATGTSTKKAIENVLALIRRR